MVAYMYPDLGVVVTCVRQLYEDPGNLYMSIYNQCNSY